ncbi:MAG: NAD(P)(+) transhydrogenase (Re/Si-specific) subunit beta [Planctomycetota bacterium]
MSDGLSIDGALQLLACAAFIVGLKLMGRQTTARLGNFVSAGGMALAVVAAVLHSGVSLPIVAIAGLVGSVIGVVLAVRVKMTGMPELVAAFNGLGGLASLAIGLVEVAREGGGVFGAAMSSAAIIVGGVAFTGSLVAFGKLSGVLPQRAIAFPGQFAATAVVAVVTLGTAVWAVAGGPAWTPGALCAVAAFGVGVLAVVRIGGGDMPVVVSLLNSYSGAAAAAAGLAIDSPVLVVAGALIGAAGLMLTQVMCKAMNRSLANVLFAGFGSAVAEATGGAQQGTVRPISASDSYYLLESAREVIVVPGYGMAVARAQHVVEELSSLLEANGTRVRFVIHPVAGRMPGHMNVLLAEAGIPYDQLIEPPDVNPGMEGIDVALVIGANDIVNPDAKEDSASPLYGMPIVEVDRAKTTIVLKRSMATGFAGVQNSLFFRPNTRMLFGDAKDSIGSVNAEFED